MFLNFIKSLKNRKNINLRICFIYSFIIAIFLSFQITEPLKEILKTEQTYAFLNEVLKGSEEEVIEKITKQTTQEQQFFYSVIHNAALSLKNKQILENLSVDQFQYLIKQALITQQILFILLFYLLFLFLFYIGRFILNLTGPYFYQASDKNFWAKKLALPFCLILTGYAVGLYFNILLSPLLLLLIAILISLLSAIKNKAKIPL